MSRIPIGVSRLGGIVYSNVILDGGTAGLDGLTINDCLVSYSNSKNVVKTPVSGRNGTVKEYINKGDYQISISGLIMENTINIFPTTRIKKFIEICEKEEAIDISCAFLNHANITTVVITDYKLAEKKGTRNGVPFSLTLISDDPITIKVNQ